LKNLRINGSSQINQFLELKNTGQL
jgi:hypothetical protein